MTKKQRSWMSICREFEREPGPCPRCGGMLQQQHQLYAVATRRGSQLTDTFMLSGDFGWYCEACPTVVVLLSAIQVIYSSNGCVKSE